MSGTILKLGPNDNGRQMRLDEFEPAEVQEGFLYEIGRGNVVVTDVPGHKHLAQLVAIRRQLSAHDLANPWQIFAIAGGSDCRILLASWESKHHPDLAVFKTAPPNSDDFWSEWVPEIVIEVVSPGSEAG